jgi:hypothetical protein
MNPMSERENQVYRSLASERRRNIIRYFEATEQVTVTINELAEYIANQETDVQPSDHETIVLDLSHVHLPLLADIGVLDFERESNTVCYRPDSKSSLFIRSHLTGARNREKKEIG